MSVMCSNGAARLLRGKPVADAIYSKILASKSPHELSTKHLVIIRTNNRPDSSLYISKKQEQLQRLGMRCTVLNVGYDEREIAKAIKRHNEDRGTSGIILQLPPDEAIKDIRGLLDSVDPSKDIDGLHSQNLGRLVTNSNVKFIPCTAAAIIRLFEHYNIQLAGMRVVILGRSMIVGTPLSVLMTQADATVTLCHSYTGNIPELCSQADIIVAAIGKATFVKNAWIGRHCKCVVDVGINKNAEGKLVGDVEPVAGDAEGAPRTPVPGGIGPVTVAMLCHNLSITL